MEEFEKKCVAITHFINPYRFWYSSTDEDTYMEVEEIEEELTKLYRSSYKFSDFSGFRIGNHVAVLFLNRNKYIRGRVEEILYKPHTKTVSSYILWAIDHGFPFEANAENLRTLPKMFSKPIDRIRCGGITNVVPIAKEFDFNEMCWSIRTNKKWCNRACESLEKLLLDSASIAFLENWQSETKQYWGDLHVISHKGKLIRCSDFLVNENVAEKNEGKFHEMRMELICIRSPVWVTNNGNDNYRKNCMAENYFLNSKRESLYCDTAFKDAQKKVEDWSCQNKRAALYSDMNKICSSTPKNVLALYDSDIDESASQAASVIEQESEMLMTNSKTSVVNPDISSPSARFRSYELPKISEKEVLHEEYADVSLLTSITTNLTENHGEKFLLKEDNGYLHEKANSSELNFSVTSKKSRSETVRSLYIEALTLKEMSIPSMHMNTKGKQKKLSSNKIHILPAGFDLGNMNKYNDDRHWHIKKSTRNEFYHI